MLPQILIVLACLVLFITTFLLNRKTKVNLDEEEVDLPDSCLNCSNKSCLEKKQKQIKVDKCNEGERKNE